MARVSNFIDDESRHERYLAKTMNWRFIEDQQKGSCYDFTTPDGSKIEAKFDWDSIKTGNHYLEFAQTSDNGKTWVPSGFALSAEEADYWVIVNEDWIRILRIDVLRNWLAEEVSTLSITQTRAGVNYNRPGQCSKAYLIPFETIDQLCLSKQRSTIARKKTN